MEQPMKYPAIFTPTSSGGFVVKFRDIPEALTHGDDEEDALDMAEDALATAMEFYFEDGRKVPMPSVPQQGERLIPLRNELSARVKASH